MANETACPISSLVVNKHYKLKLTVFTDNYITTMAGSDSVPTTTSSENGNKVSNPPLMGNPL